MKDSFKMKINNFSKKRIYAIDLFRFIASISVVLYHLLFRGWAADNMSDVSFENIGHAFKYGYLGVDLFFILSGFLITHSIKNKSISDFLVSRISRLYPIYWLSITFTSIVIIVFGDSRFSVDFPQFIMNLTMFHNYANIESIYCVYWTLFVEMKFYIFIIGIFLILNKLKEITIDSLVIFWSFFCVLYYFFDDYSIFKVLNIFLFFDYAPLFIAGIVFSQIYENGVRFKDYTILFVSLLLSLNHSIIKAEVLENYFNFQFSTIIISLIIFSFYLIILMVSMNRLNIINSVRLTKLGMLTYPLYLLHQNIGFIALNNLKEYLNKYFLVTLIIIVLIFTSYLMSKFYEPRVSKFVKMSFKNN